MNNDDDTILSDLGTRVPPTYQIILLSASMGSMVVIGFFMWLVFFLNARKIYPDSEFSPISWGPTLLSVIFYIFKFMSIISLSFLQDSQSTTNPESWFSREWIRALVTFGEGILSWWNENSVEREKMGHSMGKEVESERMKVEALSVGSFSDDATVKSAPLVLESFDVDESMFCTGMVTF